MEIHISGNYTERDFPKFEPSYSMVSMSCAHFLKSKIFVYLQIVRGIYAANPSPFPCVSSNFVLFQVASLFLLICSSFCTAQ